MQAIIEQTGGKCKSCSFASRPNCSGRAQPPGHGTAPRPGAERPMLTEARTADNMKEDLNSLELAWPT
jgi:hypothetical protein